MVKLCSLQSTWLSQGSFLLVSGLSRAHTAQLFVSTHQCIPLIPLPTGWKSAGCLREVIELFPSIPSLRREREGDGGCGFFIQENRVNSVILLLIQLTVKHNTGCGCMLRFLSRKWHCVRIIIASPSPSVSKWPHVPCRMEKFCHAFHNFSPWPVRKLLSFPYWVVFQRDFF